MFWWSSVSKALFARSGNSINSAGDDATREAVLNADDECNDANDDDDLFLLLDALVSWSSSFLDDFVPTTFSRRRRR